MTDKLELEKAFSVAIKREIEAYEFYRDISQRAQDEEVGKVFSQLAGEEMGHKDLLEKYKNDPGMVMKIKAPSKDYKVAEATELPELSIEMKPADAIALAMKKEQQAAEFYRDLAHRSTDSQMKDIFHNLENMELGHKRRLENVFVEIGYPEVF
ncbi:MAG: ferritin [Spirochaeta sp.]|nr:ferritin [Spirochaeta sp.]